MFFRKKQFGEFATKEIERDLKRYCLKYWGKWWSTRFWMNKSAKLVYDKIRGVSMTVAIRVVANDDPAYMNYISFHEDLMDEISKNKNDKIRLKKES